jgi:hypothetical protein
MASMPFLFVIHRSNYPTSLSTTSGREEILGTISRYRSHLRHKLLRRLFPIESINKMTMSKHAYSTCKLLLNAFKNCESGVISNRLPIIVSPSDQTSNRKILLTTLIILNSYLLSFDSITKMSSTTYTETIQPLETLPGGVKRQNTRDRSASFYRA